MPNISEIFSFVADIFVKILTPAISIAAFVLSIRNHFTDKKEKATGIDVGMYNVYEKEERGCKMLSFVLTVSNNSRYSISIYKMKFVFHGSEYEFDDERRYAYLPINLPGFLSEQKEMTLYPFDIELIDFQESVTIIAYTSRGILTLHTKPQP